MLRLLFDSIEQSLGSSLSGIAGAVYWSGFVLLAMALIGPLYRRLMEFVASRLGLERHWVMPCRQCGRLTVVTVATCGFCDSDLKIPIALRLWTGLTRKRLTPGARTAQWAIQLAGNVLVLALCAWLMLAAGTLQPAGDVHRLFLGFALFGLGGVVWLGARAITPASRAAFARLRDGLIALAAVGMTLVSLFLAGQAVPLPENLVARFTAEAGRATIGNEQLALPDNVLGFEYLQLDHELLGYHGIIPMAFVGQERVPVSRFSLLRPLITHLQTHPDAYAARGLTVRHRIDRHRLTPGFSYEVVERDGQIQIRHQR